MAPFGVFIANFPPSILREFLLSTQKKNVIIGVVCAIALVFAINPPAANGAELEKPKLVSFKFTPNEIDEKYSPTNVEFTVVISSATGIFNEKISVNLTNYSNISIATDLYRIEKPIDKSLATVTFKGSVTIPAALPAGPLFAYIDDVYSIQPANGNQGWPNETFYPDFSSKVVGAESSLLIRKSGDLDYAYSTFIGPSYSDFDLALGWSDPKYKDYDYPVFRIGETLDIGEYFELKVPSLDLKLSTSSPYVCTTNGKVIKFIALGDCNYTVYTDKTKDYQALTNFQSVKISSARDRFSLNVNSISNQSTKSLPKVITGPLVYDYGGGTILYPTTKTPSVCHPTSTNINLISGGICVLTYTSLANDYHLGSVKNIEFNVVKQSQEIAISPVPASIKKGRKLAITAKASSGLEISLKSKTPKVCSINKTNALAIKKGICTVELNQDGGGIFASVQKSLIIEVR